MVSKTSTDKSNWRIVLDSWVLDNLTLANELFAKVLRKFETCFSITNSLWGKPVSLFLLTIIFADSLRVTPAPLWIKWFYIYIVILSHFNTDIISTQIRFMKHLDSVIFVPSEKPKKPFSTSLKTN